MHLKNTSFSGVSGIVQFSKNTSNDRLGGAFYSLYNTQQKGKGEPKYKQIMTWYGTNHSWECCINGNNISIIWSGDQSDKTPTDYLQLRG
jgi:predicted outer membrane repeat protein